MLLADASGRLRLTPITADPKVAERWLERFQGSGIDGAVAKQGDLRYVPGRQEMVKVNHEQTADCVVGGFRVFADRPLPSSLLLGLYDGGGRLHHVGVASSFPERAREGLLEHLSPLAARPRSAVVPPRPALAAAVPHRHAAPAVSVLEVDGRPVALSNLDKVIWRDAGPVGRGGARPSSGRADCLRFGPGDIRRRIHRYGDLFEALR